METSDVDNAPIQELGLVTRQELNEDVSQWNAELTENLSQVETSIPKVS